MDIVAFVSQKGGSGKSTLAVHLASSASLRGLSVALIDLDTQESSFTWGQDRTGEGHESEEERELSALRNLSHVEVVSARIQDLPRLLSNAKEQGADLVILDTAGRTDTIAEQVIERANVVLIPCRPFRNDLRAMPRTVQQVKDVMERKESGRAFIVLNCCPVQGTRQDEVRDELAPLLDVAPVEMHYYMSFADAQNDGRGIEEYEPKGKAAEEIRALYEWLVPMLPQASRASATVAERRHAS